MSDLKELIALWKQTAWSRVEASQKISLTPCFLFSAIIASDGGGDADAQLYDGESTVDPKVLDLFCVDEALAQVSFNPPLVFQRGLFVEVGTNVESVFVQYLPISE